MTININYTYDFTPEVKAQIEEAMDWLCVVLASDEFRWKTRKYEELDEYLKKIDGFTVNIKRLYPESGINAPYGALYNKNTSTMSYNVLTASNYPKERLAGLFAHEIGHQWFDHNHLEVGSFLGHVQYKIKYMEGKSNWYYKFLLWFDEFF